MMREKVIDKKSKLINLIHEIDWLALEPKRAFNPINPKKVTVSFLKSKKTLDKRDRVLVRFGREVLEELNWEYKDKIAVYNDPDDIMTFMLVKTETKNGYTLSKESQSTNGCVNIRWTRNFSLWDLKNQEVEYDIHDRHIIFRISK